jgi:hypothetical protein
MSEVFIILNESEPRGVGSPVTEVTPYWYDSLQGAMDALASIGEPYGVFLGEDDSSIKIPVDGTSLEYDEYYIVELEKGE